MKRKIATALLALLMLTGCDTSGGSTGTQGTASSAVQIDKENKNIDLTLCLLFNDSSDYPELKEGFKKEVFDKTGYTLNLTILPRTDYGNTLNLRALAGDLKGLIKSFGTSDLIRFKEDGIIVPMTNVLSQNETWNKFPEDLRDSVYFDGEYWGIPMSYGRNLFTRSFRKDWLDNLGLKPPTTIDELYEVARAFTEDDPDGNGKNDTVGFTTAGTWTLQDIFQSFNASLNATGSSSITYDPKLGYWTDTMTRPEMIEALKWLNDLYTKGYLDKESFTNSGAAMRDKMYAGGYGSTFYWNGWAEIDNILKFTNVNPKAEIVGVTAVTGNRTEDINFVFKPSGAPYVLAKGTKDGATMVQNFIDLFITSKAGHELGRFGIEGKTFRREGDTIVILKDAQTNTYYPGPAIVGEFPQYDINNLTWANDGTPEEIKASIEALKYKASIVTEAMKDPKIYIAEYDTVISDTYLNISADISTAFKACMSTAITGEVPVEQAVKTYIETMRGMGAEKVVNEVNATYGLEAPDFKY